MSDLGTPAGGARFSKEAKLIAAIGTEAAGGLTATVLSTMLFNPDTYVFLRPASLFTMTAVFLGCGMVGVAVVRRYPERVFNDPETRPSQPFSLGAGLLVLAMLVACFAAWIVLTPILFPPFEITSPTENSTVDQMIFVEGHGAEPSSAITVKVRYATQTFPTSPPGNPNSDGGWRLNGIHIGEGDDQGKQFEILAEMNTSTGKVYAARPVTVIRG